MKIEKINEDEIKIIFDYTELEENNISIHSFLSNSIESQKLFWAILEIANEDLGFDTTNSKISYEALSYDNKNFVVFVTKSNVNYKSETSSAINELSSKSKDKIDNNFFNFLGNDLLNFQKNDFPNTLLYKFENINDVFAFCDYINTSLNNLIFNSSLHKYNNLYFIKIDINDLSLENKKKIIYLLTEFKNSLNLSSISLLKFEEFSEILIKNNAIQNL